MRIGKAFGRLLFPADIQCAVCSGEQGMGQGSCICEACQKKLPFDEQAHSCFGLSYGAAFVYRAPVSDLIRGLKYHNRRYLAPELGRHMANRARELGLKADAVIPVPLHSGKLKARGYNQSALLAREIAENLGLPYCDGILRLKRTESQTGLDESLRMENVTEAFALKEALPYKNILLVDDVITTGATLYHCAKVLKECHITGLTAARAELKADDLG